MQLYNTMTRQKETFRPLDPNHVKIYACGPTVYDYFHVGNARAFVVFDTLRRVLQHHFPKVTLVQNITDVDDKIINRANKEGRLPEDVAREFAQAFLEDHKALGCLPADLFPKATEHIPEIIKLISRILEQGYAYIVDGDVFFRVRDFKAYGRISGKAIDELASGARININERKQDPLDFALWKAAKPGEPSWASPWGAGRPGWHIECSAMAMRYLGDTFDIHGGGEDLIFPHHENENAQSECVTGKPLANYWMHNGYLKIDGQKMSKSLGNFKVVRELLGHYPYQVLRLFMLSAHYRSPLEFNQDNLDAAYHAYRELQYTIHRLVELLRISVPQDSVADPQAEALQTAAVRSTEKFHLALQDDLNTAGALGHLFSLANQVKKILSGRPQKSYTLFQALNHAQQQLLEMLAILGIDPDLSLAPPEILALLEQRHLARQQKDWAASDRLRDQIQTQGFVVEDTPFGALALKTIQDSALSDRKDPNKG